MGSAAWGNGKPTNPPRTPKPTNPPKTPRPTVWKAPPTPRPTNPPKVKTPKPTNTPKTSKPTSWKAPKTPKPTKGPKTPKPTNTKPTKTPKPTVWKAPKTPKPTNPPKTPRPTYPPKTPKPTATYVVPAPTVTYVTPEPTDACPVLSCQDPCRTKCGANYECTTKSSTTMGGRCPGCDVFDTCEYVGWTGAKTPMTGCAENMAKKGCNRQNGCVWKEGYPPMSFSEDSDYQLLDAEESFFAVDGSAIDMINNMDTNMLMISGVVFVAVLLLAIKQCSGKKEKKDVYVAIAEKDYGSVAVVN